MKQVLFGRGTDELNNAATEFNAFVGDVQWNETETNVMQLVSASGTFTKLRIKLDGSPGEGKSWTFTLMVNNISRALTCTISDTDTTCFNIKTVISVSAGDSFSLRATSSGTPTNRNARWSIVFEGSGSRESLIPVTSASVSRSGGNRHHVPMGSSAWAQDPSGRQGIIPTNGIIKDLYVKAVNGPGTDPEAVKFTLLVDGVESALSVTLTGSQTEGQDTSSQVTVVPGERVQLKAEQLNDPSDSTVVAICMTFLADTDGESIVLGYNGESIAGSPIFSNIPAGNQTEALIESEVYAPLQSCLLSKLYVAIGAAPGSADQIFTVRKNESDTALSVTISGSDTTGKDISNVVSFSNDDDTAIERTEVSNPNFATHLYWGLVMSGVRPPTGDSGHYFVASTAWHWIDEFGFEQTATGILTGASGEAGHYFVNGNYWHYVDENGKESRILGTKLGATGKEAGQFKVFGTRFHYIADSGDEYFLPPIATMNSNVFNQSLFNG